jgi:hypothetical protein
MDLKTREPWTQLYSNTSQILNEILKDRQMRDWEKRLSAIEEYRKNPKGAERSHAKPFIVKEGTDQFEAVILVPLWRRYSMSRLLSKRQRVS